VSEETLDGALGGAVRILQHRRGYRFSLDSILLADFASPAQGRVVDLGTGSGVVALVLAHRSPAAMVIGIEVQASLAERAQRSVLANGLQERVTIVRGDLRKLEGIVEPGSVDLVVANPPYQPLEAGRRNPDAERAIARHEVHATVADVAQSAQRLLRSSGRLAVVYPARRREALQAALDAAGFRVARSREVLPRLGDAAKLLLVEAAFERGGPIAVLPPLVLHGEARDYTPEARAILGEPERR
jgi:tRNA1Val (adenine37-N6)-methyltransferase